MHFPLPKNTSTTERLIRAFIAELLFLGAYFWVGGVWQLFAYAVGVVMLGTALTGFCGVYKVCAIETTRDATKKKVSTLILIGFLALFLVTAVAGSYYSAFFTKKFFLNDYNHMNNYYKQTLFFTGQDKRAEATENYAQLVATYDTFSKKYTTYHPHAIKSDRQFNTDIARVKETINSLQKEITTGDLHKVHLTLETIRPIFQDILKRNGFSMLAVALVDFHDAMEKVIESADNQDSAQLLAVYPEVDTKLQAVEEITNDEEIQHVRTKLEEVMTLAQEGATESLPDKASELKNAFVKVYLKRG